MLLVSVLLISFLVPGGTFGHWSWIHIIIIPMIGIYGTGLHPVAYMPFIYCVSCIYFYLLTRWLTWTGNDWLFLLLTIPTAIILTRSLNDGEMQNSKMKTRYDDEIK